jgi:hypothetical protein
VVVALTVSWALALAGFDLALLAAGGLGAC